MKLCWSSLWTGFHLFLLTHLAINSSLSLILSTVELTTETTLTTPHANTDSTYSTSSPVTQGTTYDHVHVHNVKRYSDPLTDQHNRTTHIYKSLPSSDTTLQTPSRTRGIQSAPGSDLKDLQYGFYS